MIRPEEPDSAEPESLLAIMIERLRKYVLASAIVCACASAAPLPANGVGATALLNAGWLQLARGDAHAALRSFDTCSGRLTPDSVKAWEAFGDMPL